MKERKPYYFNKFNCIADKCEDTCCAGWGIVIDDKSYEKYLSLNSDFGKVLRSKIIEDEGDKVFLLTGDRCSFLNKNNLCEIYNNIGEEGLCYTCKQYPRYLEEFGSLREVGISLSCPEAARIILNSNEKVYFELNEIDEEVSNYNDINANLYINLMQCRKIVFDIIQDRSLNINIRVSMALIFINEVQEKIDSSNIGVIQEVKNKYSDKGFINNLINKFDKYKNNGAVKYSNVKEFLETFRNLKHIKQNDILGIEDALRYFWQSEDDKELYLKNCNDFNNYYTYNEYKFEQILIYFIYRYFMKAVFDYDVIGKIKFAIVSYIMIKELACIRFLENKEFTEEDMVDIAHTYSKDIEHLEENVEVLQELFETKEFFALEEILYVLLA